MAVIEIDTLQKFINFSNGEYGRGTSSEYLEVELVTDLDFADLSDSQYNWNGCTGDWYIHFNGNDHIIDNINFIGTGAWGFFYRLKYGSTVDNLKLTNMHVVTNNLVGGLVCLLEGNCYIRNCHITGYIENLNTGTYYQDNSTSVAGMVAYPQSTNNNYSYVFNSSFVGTLKIASTSGHIHGLIGHGFNNGMYMMIANCHIEVHTSGSTENYVIGVCYDCHAPIYNTEIILHGSGEVGFGAPTANCIVIPKEKTSGDGDTYTINSHSGNYPTINCILDYDALQTYNATLGEDHFIHATTAQIKDKEWLYNHGIPI